MNIAEAMSFSLSLCFQFLCQGTRELFYESSQVQGIFAAISGSSKAAASKVTRDSLLKSKI